MKGSSLLCAVTDGLAGGTAGLLFRPLFSGLFAGRMSALFAIGGVGDETRELVFDDGCGDETRELTDDCIGDEVLEFADGTGDGTRLLLWFDVIGLAIGAGGGGGGGGGIGAWLRFTVAALLLINFVAGGGGGGGGGGGPTARTLLFRSVGFVVLIGFGSAAFSLLLLFRRLSCFLNSLDLARL